ncbi:type III PLP-dependent enzyme [Saccharomonospora xinjiangensis]|uniref:ornithine decarboxylase n=1 Tax=Saccharomonospora xinjiangensis XJ-54 TaxID=882086 RepID=I0V714_9PSEU|nr:type III PLP-dependent enzyme [Saccharomonospora xinjiangensis]EID55917.1 diaminopimelate decarboxylase [Saccharomonospora xinjiangensis XJ-54]
MNDTVARIRAFLDTHRPPTPCLVIDIDTVIDRYRRLTSAFPGCRVQYAVKANPHPAVLRALVEAGAAFDVASPGEIELCLAAGAEPGTLSYGNTIKKPSDIAHADARGVREYTFDSASDLDNLAACAPGAQVSARLLVRGGPDSVTPFGHKFGCPADDAATLLRRAAEKGLVPVGVSFHVGSQQLDPTAWDVAVAEAAKVFAATAEHGAALHRLNIGGGFGIPYNDPAPEIGDYADAVTAAVRAHFPRAPELVCEPGRAVVAEAGLIRSEVVVVSRKLPTDPHRWVFLDIGRYNGLAETENEAIAYRLEPVGQHSPEDGPVIIAGPTCDGDDVLYQRTPYRLPMSLRPGDAIDILASGAYTASYSSVAFNGIEPLRTYCISEGRLISAE